MKEQLCLRSMVCAACFAIFLAVSVDLYGQVSYPRPSQRQSIEQTVGDTEIRIVYHRPNASGRLIYGTDAENALVPYGKVWRAGANEATVFEFTNDVSVNGKKLEKGKYSFYVIPTVSDWTVIFNKSWNQWGTVYNEAEDALRVNVTPVMSVSATESLSYTIEDVTGNSAKIVLSWEKARLPFVIDVGDVNGRILSAVRREIVGGPVSAANYIISQKIVESYAEALDWLEGSLARFETYGALFAKSRLLAEMGRKQDAIAAGERALEVGRKGNVNPNSLSFLEGLLKTWKTED